MPLEQDLIRGAAALGFNLTENQSEALLSYIGLLQKWNNTYKLTAITEPNEILVKHIFDCLAVVKPIESLLLNNTNLPKSVLDVGSGAGLPGILLALFLPEVQVTMLDAVGKKMQFVQFAIAQLKLQNAKAVTSRIELYTEQHGIVTARAWTALDSMLPLVEKNLCAGGYVAAMKSKSAEEELTTLPNNFLLKNQLELTIPNLNQTRNLLFLKKA